MTTQASLVCFGILVTSAAAQAERDRTPVPMDGPVADPCKVLKGEPDDGNPCAVMTTAKFGALTVAVYLVGADATKPQGVHAGSYFLAIKNKAGWWTAHQPLDLPPYWREHGGGHNLIPTEPQLLALQLASRRPAFAFDVPIDEYIDDCNDAVGDAKQPRPSIAQCQAAARTLVDARVKALRAHPTKLTSSPIAIGACGQRADQSWACVAPINTGASHMPIVRYSRDGHLPGLEDPGDQPLAF